jgi:ribosomal protein S18 acetylase RimI-like enzyme
MIKKFTSFLKENIDIYKFKIKKGEDTFSLLGYFDGDLAGRIDITILSDAYTYEFADIMSEDKYDSIFETRNVAHLENLVVDEYYQNSGLGKKLIELAFKELKRRNIKEIYLNAYPKGKGLDLTDLVEFYKKSGFNIILNQGGNVLMYSKI